MSVLLRLKTILFQADVRSDPPRTNFKELENALNNFQAQLDAAITVGSGAEVVNARDYYGTLRERIRYLTAAIGKNVLVSGGVVGPTGATMTLDVTAGDAIIGGVGCSWVNSTSGAIPPVLGVGNKRYSLVVANSDNSISIINGTTAVAAAALPPVCSASQKALALVRVVYGQTTIAPGDVFTVYRESAIEGLVIWIVERNLKMDFHFDVPAAGNYSLRLPPGVLIAGDEIKITDNRNPMIYSAHYYIDVMQYYSAAWNKIAQVSNGTVELSVHVSTPVANGIVVNYRVVNPYTSGAKCVLVSCAGLAPLVLGSLYYVRQPNPVPGWNLGTGRWTAPFDGFVSVEVAGHHNGSNGLNVWKNGAAINEAPASQTSDGAGAVYNFMFTTRFPVVAGDVVDLRPSNAVTAATFVMNIAYVQGI